MKKVVLIILSLFLLDCCSINRDHTDRYISFKYYVTRIWNNFYYYPVHILFDTPDHDKAYDFTAYEYAVTPGNPWKCEIYGDDKRESTITSATVTITKEGSSRLVVVDGSITEDGYLTKFYCLGGEIRDDEGIFRVEVYQGTTMFGWADVQAKSDPQNIIITTGEP